MKVLLLSPLPGLDPACGDVTYTETLLANPPDGVEYVTYAQALEDGTLLEHGRRESLGRALRERRRLAGEACLTAVQKSLNLLRRRGLLFREPFRFFSVRPGAFDLIHCHVFSCRFFQLPCPLVVSNAAPLRFLYTGARGWSPRRADRVERVEKALARVLGVNHVSYHVPQVSRLIAFTRFLQEWYIRAGVLPADRLDVVPIFLPARSAATPSGAPRRVGFVAKDFEAKGGPTLLRAFEEVRRSLPEAELHIVGCEPRMDAEEAANRGIVWTAYIPRDRLLADIFPKLDVYAHPTKVDGLPLTVLEALSFGLPVATSDYQAMPEIVGQGTAGLVSPAGDAGALAANIIRLLEPAANRAFREAAYNHFLRTYSTEAVLPKLKACYEQAVAEWRRTGS